MSSQAVQKLKPELQKQVRGILLDQCGTPAAPILLGSGRSTSPHLKQGSAIYSKYCVQCHGVTGDGNGPAAVYIVPKRATIGPEFSSLHRRRTEPSHSAKTWAGR